MMRVNFSPHNQDLIVNSLNTDGGFSSKENRMYWKVVDTLTGEILVDRSYNTGTSNVSEFLAIVDGLKLSHQKYNNIPVYNDNITAIRWALEGSCFTWSEDLSTEVGILISEAEEWLKDEYLPAMSFWNADCNMPVIKKWHTKLWGDPESDAGNKHIGKKKKKYQKEVLEFYREESKDLWEVVEGKRIRK